MKYRITISINPDLMEWPGITMAEYICNVACGTKINPYKYVYAVEPYCLINNKIIKQTRTLSVSKMFERYDYEIPCYNNIVKPNLLDAYIQQMKKDNNQ